MLNNVESLLSSGLLQRYSCVLLLLSVLCVGVDSANLLLFGLNPNFNAENRISAAFGGAVRLNGQGIWCGLFGISVAAICNALAIEKGRESLTVHPRTFARVQQKILNTEAALFGWTILVSVAAFCAVLMSGYSTIELMANRLIHTQIEQMVFLLNATLTLLVLTMCLTTFTLTIYSFNVLLPLYYSSILRDLYSGALFQKVASAEKWKDSPTCEFGHSFSGSSIQFGTIETLSERSIPALTRKLTIKRLSDNFSDGEMAPQSAIPSNRTDLISL